MMTKWTQLFLTAALAVALAACDSSGSDSSNGFVATPTVQQSAVSSAATSSSSTSSATNTSSTPDSSSTGGGSSSSTEEPVTAPAPTGGKISATWSVPTQREDGSPLTLAELQGYEIYYYKEGSNPGTGTVVSISDPSTTSYVTDVLSAGTWYFAISSVDTDGMESELTSYLTVTIL